jgi:hypothetical protein
MPSSRPPASAADDLKSQVELLSANARLRGLKARAFKKKFVMPAYAGIQAI